MRMSGIGGLGREKGRKRKGDQVGELQRQMRDLCRVFGHRNWSVCLAAGMHSGNWGLGEQEEGRSYGDMHWRVTRKGGPYCKLEQKSVYWSFLAKGEIPICRTPVVCVHECSACFFYFSLR